MLLFAWSIYHHISVLHNFFTPSQYKNPIFFIITSQQLTKLFLPHTEMIKNFSNCDIKALCILLCMQSMLFFCDIELKCWELILADKHEPGKKERKTSGEQRLGVCRKKLSMKKRKRLCLNFYFRRILYSVNCSPRQVLYT